MPAAKMAASDPARPTALPSALWSRGRSEVCPCRPRVFHRIQGFPEANEPLIPRLRRQIDNAKENLRHQPDAGHPGRCTSMIRSMLPQQLLRSTPTPSSPTARPDVVAPRDVNNDSEVSQRSGRLGGVGITPRVALGCDMGVWFLCSPYSFYFFYVFLH
jgi:hypothetical protein